MKDSDILTTTQAARIAHLSVSQINKLFDAGMLAGFKIPGSWTRRIHRHSFIAWLRDNGIIAQPIKVYVLKHSDGSILGVYSTMTKLEAVKETCEFDGGYLETIAMELDK